MSPRKSRPPITYANTLDKKPKAKLAPKQSKSPHSARPAFKQSLSTSMRRKAKRANEPFAPRPEPKLQPKGIGEHGVNWTAHIARLQKAKKAVKINRTASKSFDLTKANDLSKGR